MTSSTMTTTNLLNNQDYFIQEPKNAQELVNLVNINFIEKKEEILMFFFLKVQNTMSQIQDKFGQMSDSITTRSKYKKLMLIYLSINFKF